MEIVAKRLEFLELLAEAGPMAPRDILEAVEYSRPTFTPALRELREADLVGRAGDGYTPTLAGRMAAAVYRRYERTTDAILRRRRAGADPRGRGATRRVARRSRRDRHAVSGSGPRARIRLRARPRGRDGQGVSPHARGHALPRRLASGRRRDGRRERAIFPPDLLAILQGQYPTLLAEMAAADGFEVAAAAGPPLGIILTSTAGDATVTVVYEDDSAVTGVLENDSAAAVQWAGTELDRLARGAETVTDDLAALSATVPDGLGRRPGARSEVDGTPPGTQDPARATEGHPLPIDLEAAGFVRFSAEYFETHGQAPPEIGWRTGFTLVWVHAGPRRPLARSAPEPAHSSRRSSCSCSS